MRENRVLKIVQGRRSVFLLLVKAVLARCQNKVT